jgi:hypothetical protein
MKKRGNIRAVRKVDQVEQPNIVIEIRVFSDHTAWAIDVAGHQMYGEGPLPLEQVFQQVQEDVQELKELEA